ncbi:MAG: HlyD family type I secretion periplasmic adaptor subunit [Pseudomonadota bacterium]
MSAPTKWSARTPLIVGLTAVIILVGGFGTWSVVTAIAGAVIAPGQLQVESERQVIQHIDGGIVGELPVNDGDFVTAGDIVMRLDDTDLRSELTIIEGQYYELMARRARLFAESRDLTEITFDDELIAEAARTAEVADLMEGQRSLFLARRETRERQIEQLSERQAAIEQEIIGLQAQREANRQQQRLVAQEVDALQSLLDRGLTQQSRVLELRRGQADLLGRAGALDASVAQGRVRISELETEKLGLADRVREQALEQLRDLTFNERELEERRSALIGRLSRLDIRAPVSGFVLDRQIQAVRAVIRPAEPLMFIVPEDSPLVIISQVEPIHVDEVRVGQEAGLRFSALDFRTTPELNGVVSRVSADIIQDPNTGLQYYEAEITPLPGEMDRLEGKELIPGMPVEAFIQTGSRSPLNYLTKPLTDYFTKAFRES